MSAATQDIRVTFPLVFKWVIGVVASVLIGGIFAVVAIAYNDHIGLVRIADNLEDIGRDTSALKETVDDVRLDVATMKAQISELQKDKGQ